RFRQSKNPKADYVGVKGHMSNWLEGGVAVVEAVLLIGFAVPLWAKVVSNPPSEKNATVIHVLGRQFNWNGHYAGVDGKMGRQELRIIPLREGQTALVCPGSLPLHCWKRRASCNASKRLGCESGSRSNAHRITDGRRSRT